MSDCKHMLLKRSKIGLTVVYRCTDCKELLSAKPFEIKVVPAT